MTDGNAPNVQHSATDTEAANGQGTAELPTTGVTLDRPVLGGASEYSGDKAERVNPGDKAERVNPGLGAPDPLEPGNLPPSERLDR